MTLASIRVSRFVPFAATALVALAGLAIAGPLTPPSGAVSSSYKTLGEVEPRIAINLTNTPGDGNSLFRITQPGSYYLTGNVVGVNGKTGIEVEASNVTIDLNGFSLIGVGSALVAISPSSVVQNIEVCNGSISNWPSNAVSLQTASRVVLRDLRVTSNGGFGIVVGPGSRIADCIASDNVSHGFYVSSNSVVANCVGSSNGGCGILAQDGVTIVGSTVTGNSSAGISVGTGCSVRACTSNDNNNVGILVGIGSIVEHCVVRANDLDGIRTSDRSRIVGNICSANGQTVTTGAGIRMTGSGNYLEGNNSTGQDTGYDADALGNILVRNTAAGNTDNWALVAGNRCLVVNATAAGVISGNSGGVSLGSTDPNANFTY